MRNTKLWSVLLVSVLLCACVLGVLFTGASAADVAKTYTVNTASTENDEAGLSFKSIADALASILLPVNHLNKIGKRGTL